MNNWRNVAERCLRDEAEAILNLIPQMDEGFMQAVNIILECQGKLIITGVGKSGHIGAKIAATLSSTGTPSFFINPLDAFHGDLGVITKGDVVLAISNSGQTDELLRLLPCLQARKVPVVAMSGNPNSLLAKHSAAHLNCAVSHEACPLGLAPTSSTTAALALGDALACALMDARNFRESDFAKFHPGGSLGRRLLTKATDVMHHEDLPILPSQTKMSEALIRMSAGRLGLCVAVDNGEVKGIITDGDIRRAMENKPEQFLNLCVADIMTSNPKCVDPDTRVSEIDEILQRCKIHSVLVCDCQGQLLGIVDSFSTML